MAVSTGENGMGEKPEAPLPLTSGAMWSNMLSPALQVTISHAGDPCPDTCHMHCVFCSSNVKLNMYSLAILYLCLSSKLFVWLWTNHSHPQLLQGTVMRASSHSVFFKGTEIYKTNKYDLSKECQRDRTLTSRHPSPNV